MLSSLTGKSEYARDPYARGVSQATGPACYVEIDGTEFESRDFAYTDDILTLADSWSVTLPCPDGKATALDGRRLPLSYFKPGALVKFRETDPDVEAGAKLPKMIGRLVEIADSNDERNGFTLSLTGYDLGWHLTTGHGPVYQNYRGVNWVTLLNLLVLNPADKWGFAGVRIGNLENKLTKIGGRDALNAAKFQGVAADGKPQPGAIQRRFQVEIGQSIGPIIIDMAKWARRLVNVSADGYLQIYSPVTSSSFTKYAFYHQSAEQDSILPRNNVFRSSLRQSAATLSTITQCWTTIVTRPDNANTTDPNYGSYEGQFTDSDLLSFRRRNTFSDSNQMGKTRAQARARWAHDRGVFDSWEYTFITAGHSQGGIPFMSDTIASLNDTVRGIQGVFYVQRVKPVRKLAAAGLSPGAGTYTEITLRKPDLLGA